MPVFSQFYDNLSIHGGYTLVITWKSYLSDHNGHCQCHCDVMWCLYFIMMCDVFFYYYCQLIMANDVHGRMHRRFSSLHQAFLSFSSQNKYPVCSFSHISMITGYNTKIFYWESYETIKTSMNVTDTGTPWWLSSEACQCLSCISTFFLIS